MAKSSEDFVLADNRNLPDVSILMLIEYMLENRTYSTAEIRIAKELLRSKEIYIDTAVGYVELKREDNACTVKCKLMSELTVVKKLFDITAVINESTETIVKLECQECEGCRHTIYFALWLIKRSGESLEEYISYWTPPIFDEVEKCGGFLTAKQLAESPEEEENTEMEIPEDSSFLDSFVAECKKRNIKSRLISYITNETFSDDEEFTSSDTSSM